MPKATKAAVEVDDPTFEKVPVRISGKTYDLCFDLRALMRAESALKREGYNVNLLLAFPEMGMESTVVMFAAALRMFHPKVTFEEARDMLAYLPNMYTVARAVQEAWEKNTADPADRPTEAVAE